MKKNPVVLDEASLYAILEAAYYRQSSLYFNKTDCSNQELLLCIFEEAYFDDPWPTVDNDGRWDFIHRNISYVKRYF